MITASELYEKLKCELALLDSQEEYGRTMASIFAFHEKKIELKNRGIPCSDIPSRHCLVVSPTGSGKTYIVRKLSALTGTNVVFIDTSVLVREGWYGVSLGMKLLEAKRALNNDERFKHSIVFFDEFDKARLYSSHNDQGSPLFNILQLFNGDSTYTAEDYSKREAVEIDISSMTFVAAGAFDGLSSIVRKRLKKTSSIGFNSAFEVKLSENECLRQATVEDFSTYGMPKEIMGRFSTIVTLPPMSVEDFKQLLSQPKGAFWRYQNYFASHGIEVAVTDSAIEVIADEAMSIGTGARAVNPILNRLFNKVFDTVDDEPDINRIILDADDGCCNVQYEYGLRKSGLLSRTPQGEKPIYCLRTKTVTQMANILFSDYVQAGGDPNIFELSSFLHCALQFLFHETNPEDFCFNSLIKLADTSYKEDGDYVSVFDIMLGDVLDKPSSPIMEQAYCKEFKEICTTKTSGKIKKALELLLVQLKKKHNCSDVIFHISQ